MTLSPSDLQLHFPFLEFTTDVEIGSYPVGLEMGPVSTGYLNITYLGTNRLEARQGIDCCTLVIHAAALSVGQHIHEIVHLWSRAILCLEQRQVGMNIDTEGAYTVLPTLSLKSPGPLHSCYIYVSGRLPTIPLHGVQLTAFWSLAWSSLQGTALFLHPITLHVAQQVEEAFLVR